MGLLDSPKIVELYKWAEFEIHYGDRNKARRIMNAYRKAIKIKQEYINKHYYNMAWDVAEQVEQEIKEEKINELSIVL